MTEWWVIWGATLLVMAIIMVFSYAQAVRRKEFASVSTITGGDLIRHEARSVALALNAFSEVMRPWIAQVLLIAGGALLQLAIRSYGAFTARVFGKSGIEKGKSTSFFLKHIAEFKEELGREDRLM